MATTSAPQTWKVCSWSLYFSVYYYSSSLYSLLNQHYACFAIWSCLHLICHNYLVALNSYIRTLSHQSWFMLSHSTSQSFVACTSQCYHFSILSVFFIQLLLETGRPLCLILLMKEMNIFTHPHHNCVYIRYLELLNKHKPKIKWDDHCAEHYFSYK